MLKRAGVNDLHSKRILEVGCGNGFWLGDFVKWGADPTKITGIDLDARRVAEARRRTPAAVTVRCVDGALLSDPASSYDLVLQSTLFTSVLDHGTRCQIASEMTRVLADDGLILWYDFHVNNPDNANVRRVTKSEIRLMFPRCNVRLERITLAPPLARMVAPWSVSLCAALEMFPPLCTHYLGAIRKIRLR